MEDRPPRNDNCWESVQTTTTCKTDPQSGELICDRIRKKIRHCPGKKPQEIEVVKEEGVKGSNVLTNEFEVTVDFNPLRNIFKDIFRGSELKQSFIRSIWDEIEDQQETETSPEFVKKHLKHDPDKDTEVSAPPFKDQKRKRNYPPIKIEDEKTKENENEEDDYWVYDPKRSASYRGGGGLFSTKRSFDRIFEEMIREILGDDDK